ncbi:MAG: type II toxin-antitoxin system HicB family antitoxin [Candidatus Kapaibacterium sp.]
MSLASYTKSNGGQRQWRLPYPVLLYPDPEGGYVAEIPELKGCLAQGESEFECLTELEQVLTLWLATKREAEVPKPDTDRFIERIRQAVM